MMLIYPLPAEAHLSLSLMKSPAGPHRVGRWPQGYLRKEQEMKMMRHASGNGLQAGEVVPTKASVTNRAEASGSKEEASATMGASKSKV